MNRSVKSQLFSSDLLCESYEKIIHSSGLEIYVFPKKFSAAYAIFGVKYGSLDSCFALSQNAETTSFPDGIAHFLEHKLFTNEDGSDSFEHFSEYGADANAYTSFNKTAYLFNCTEHFDKALAELLDFVTHPYFTPDSVAAEIGIISEEIKMYDDNPSDRCFYGMLEGMYENHPIRQNICGSEQSIRQISADTLYTCYNAFYKLSNMVLIVCGDVDADTVMQVVNEQLPAHDERFDVIRQPLPKEKPQAYKPLVEQKMQVSKPLFNIGIKDIDIPSTPFERQKKDAAMSILDEMIFSRAGKLYGSLFEKNLISPNISYGYTITDTSAYNSVAGEAENPRLVLDEILKYIDRLRTEGLSEEAFARGKCVMYSDFVKSFDSVDSIANNMFSFVCEGAELLSYADIIESVSFEDVCRLFEVMFDPACITLSVINPLE